MKFNFDNIMAPEMDPTNRNRVTGEFPDDSKVTVERHLNGWDVNLKITVGGVIWHDSKAAPDEITSFDKLRQRAQNRASDIRDNHATASHNAAAKWLLGKA